MTIGQVTATSLNLRDAPDGTVIGFLVKGTTVSILAQNGKWLQVTTVGGVAKKGWVSGDFVAQGGVAPPPSDTTTAPAAIPPADDDTHKVTVVGNKAIGPDGQAFATRKNSGFYTLGKTTLRAWLDGKPPPAGQSESVVRCVRAVSLNEGRLEAINSYDNAFLSIGIFQWTAGSNNDPGELAGLLNVVQQQSSDAFNEYFGRYDLGIKITSQGSGRLTTGFLTLAGKTLDNPADKQQLRAAEWAYRFWRAGHDDRIRLSELVCAATRIPVFLNAPTHGHPINAWFTSEQGIALVLDEHVNRPGHVPGTLGAAIVRLGATPDLPNWKTADEARLIELYCDEREKTNMTDPEKRAGRIADCVVAGTLSDERGSFSP